MEGMVLKKAAQDALLPATLYGIFKTANEHRARVYWEWECIRSIGPRPGIVYGSGRDRGLSAGPTLAVEAALLGQDYEIAFGDRASMQFVGDVAKSFVACDLEAREGAATYNMHGQVLDVEEMIGIIGELVPSARGRITCRRAQTIAMASIVEDSGLQALIGPFEPTPFRKGVGETADFFRRVHRLSD
jgi:nucleoside-diphosphate-sugar epimerase